MLHVPRQQTSLDQLAERLHHACTSSLEPIAVVISYACSDVTAHTPYARENLKRLSAAGAWIDAALALLTLEAPQWTLRRLTFDDGEWFCSLSRYPQLPIEIDDTIDSRHEIAAIAILLALVETRKAAQPEFQRATAVRLQRLSAVPMNCDDFA
ncbi:hypothetical protein [Rhodoplanes sp. Z2-YC6860]|uniref:hypothetical protein n=1 Tax=Rhodoplanes sp. Z2-YC6860 TaxID=674703 RepID=UPI0008327487|nr:hypothetical protein [Rhodoplanes sp. Z2-YC6860]